MKKSFSSFILWLIVIVIPIIALAGLPDPAHCPAVEHNLHHDIVPDLPGTPKVTSYDDNNHNFDQACPEHCKQCTYNNYLNPYQKFTQPHSKGRELEEMIYCTPKNEFYHNKRTLRTWKCNFEDYGCGAEIEEYTPTVQQKHYCVRHMSVGNMYIHTCRCGRTKYSPLYLHY